MALNKIKVFLYRYQPQPVCPLLIGLLAARGWPGGELIWITVAMVCANCCFVYESPD